MHYTLCARARKIATISAKLLIIAITLFFVGPELGSLDIDSDGVPDVPVVIMQAGHALNVLSLRKRQQETVMFTSRTSFLELRLVDLELIRTRLAFDLKGFTQPSAAPIRC